MRFRFLSSCGFLLLATACSAETATAPDVAVHDGTTSPQTMTNGKGVPCHFTVAGCEGEGPDGFSQDPGTSGNGGGGGGFAVPADPGGAQAYLRCTNQCTQNVSAEQSYWSCQRTCAGSGAPHVVHLPGQGYIPYGPPSGDSYGSCMGDCSTYESACVAACGTGGVF